MDFIRELGKIDIECSYSGLGTDKVILKSYVKTVESDYILIDFLFHKKSEFVLVKDKWVKVHFKDRNGVYSGECCVLGRDDSSHLSGIKLSFPHNIKFKQQREYVRVPLKLKIEIIIFIDESGSEIKTHNATTLDISGSGFCFVSDEPVSEHFKTLALISLPDPNEKPVEVILKHVYSRPFFAQGKERFKNAFTFEEIDEKLRERILKEIFLFQIELKKKGF
jgi:c-di-GMP-binding flagellar brake protein YcgR